MHFSAEDFANVSKSTLPSSFALSEMARRPQNGVLFTAHTCATAPVSISQEIAQSMNVVKGVGLGIAAGAAVAAVSSAMMNGGKKSAKARTKEMRRSTAKAVHTVGQLIDGVENMLK